MSKISGSCYKRFMRYRFGLMALSVLFASQVNAESFLCDATQASSNQLPVLEQSCPIGKGLWGNSAPSSSQDSSLFWIQCGLLAKPLSLEKAKPIYQKISTNVWMKHEQKGYRCLIGPYNTYADAKRDLSQVRTLEEYPEAFIRMVTKKPMMKESMTEQPMARDSKPAMAEKPMKAATPVAMKPQPKPVLAEKAYPKEEEMATLTIEKRLSAMVAGREYMVPYLLDDEHQFYMEHNKPWNRLDYESAKLVCFDVDMRLSTEEEWQRLLESNVMERDDWPMHLPYWGGLKKGLFTNGNITQLRGTSLLNVLCVK